MQDSQSLEQAKSFFISGLEKLNSNNLSGAEIDFESALRHAPNRISILVNLSIVLINANKLKKAEKIIHEGLVFHAKNKDLLLSLVEIYKRIISFNKNYAEVHVNLGNVYRELNMYEESLTAYNKAIKLKPNLAESYANRGNVLQNLKKYKEALEDYSTAIIINPNQAEVYSNRGNALKELLRYEEALENQNKAIEINPNYAEAFYNSGVILAELNRYEQALASYEKAIYIKQNYAEAYYNRGVIFSKLNQLEHALICYEKAFYINPNYAEAYYNYGVTLSELRLFDKALKYFNITLELIPNYEYLLGAKLHSKMNMCDWQDFEVIVAKLLLLINEGEKSSTSFPILSVTDLLSIQRKASEIEINDKYPFNPSLGIITKNPRKEKIKIGYYSADFRVHPVSLLIVELFELHDKNQFEFIAFYFGVPDSSKMHKRVSLAFDKFIDVSQKKDNEVAEFSRKIGIDIAIDLTGLTQVCRAGIFSYRAAPIQVNFLGFSGTIGAEYYDYIIADKVVIPEDMKIKYKEKIIYLPDCYLPRDRTQKISTQIFSKDKYNLPSVGFIFCCFNAAYKITPSIFNSWMKILKAVDNSIIWISVENDLSVSNLKMEAEKRGICSSRLIFAHRTELIEEHLARQRLADLFLDTLPYNAHTTASDALWAGLPILTCMGESFASRVAASLLNAIDIPELITRTQAEYESKAIELARNPVKLKAIKDKLQRNRLTTALFDTPRFTKNIEAAYKKMYENYHDDLPINHIYIEA